MVAGGLALAARRRRAATCVSHGSRVLESSGRSGTNRRIWLSVFSPTKRWRTRCRTADTAVRAAQERGLGEELGPPSFDLPNASRPFSPGHVLAWFDGKTACSVPSLSGCDFNGLTSTPIHDYEYTPPTPHPPLVSNLPPLLLLGCTPA
ncbi:unnamed protein product, partial [Ectocarpus sp. 4 AP-2014]